MPRLSAPVGPALNRLFELPRRALLGAGCLAVLACSDSAPDQPPEEIVPASATPRGVLFVVVDTLRADYVGAHGSDKGLTPELDALAADSLVFDNTIAASSWTRPALASMFTGQYPTTVDVLTKQDVLSDELETLAERLAGAGLRCLAVSTNGNAGSTFGFAQGFEQFVSRLPKRGYPDDFPVVTADEVTKKGLEMVDSLEQEQPFFLFMHYIDPHDPYLPHPDLMTEPEPPGRFNGSRRDLVLIDQLGWKDRTEADEARMRWLYSGEVRYCDIWLGKLFEGLRERGLLDDLLVVVTSDHGEGLFDHNLRAHGTDMYQEQLHVPLVIRFPREGAPQPAKVQAFASHVDLAPTILGAYGLEIPENFQGRDLGLAARSGKLEVEGSYAYSEMNFTGLDFESVSDGNAKLIRNRAYDGTKADAFEYEVRKKDTISTISRVNYGRLNHVQDIVALNPGLVPAGQSQRDVVLEPGTILKMPAQRLPPGGTLEEYYRLDEDPGEHEDLADTLEGRGTRLRQLMKHFADENLAGRIEGGNLELEDLDPEVVAELRALGYLGGDS